MEYNQYIVFFNYNAHHHLFSNIASQGNNLFVKNTKCLHFSVGNRAGLSPGPACGHLPDWLDQNGHNGGNQCPAGEGGREDGSLGHEGLQGPVAHRHPGQAQTVRPGW